MIPDKIVFHGDQMLVVDFKTGAKSPAHKEQLPIKVEPGSVLSPWPSKQKARSGITPSRFQKICCSSLLTLF